jgi:hypothetical protein
MESSWYDKWNAHKLARSSGRCSIEKFKSVVLMAVLCFCNLWDSAFVIYEILLNLAPSASYEFF